MPKQISVYQFLSRIRKKCEGKRYIFRGTPRRYSNQISTVQTTDGTQTTDTITIDVRDGISSSLYRDLKDIVLFWDRYRPLNAEQEIMQRAKRFFQPDTSDSEILTDLQHLQHPHGKTNLIDFSRSLDIALFFACDEECHEKDGELIILDPSNLRDQKHWGDRIDPTPCVMEPAKTKYSRERVLFQRSVFVYPPYGYINKDMCKMVVVPVPVYLKESILDYLHETHEIYTDTIYNDLFGFLANRKNYQVSARFFSEGVKLANKGDHKGAIEKYSKAIGLDPNVSMYFNNRGHSKVSLALHREAFPDFDRAIELDGKNANAFLNRGIVKHYLAIYEDKESINIPMLESAISDYIKASEFDPSNEKTHSNYEKANSLLERVLSGRIKKLHEINPAEFQDSRI